MAPAPIVRMDGDTELRPVIVTLTNVPAIAMTVADNLGGSRGAGRHDGAGADHGGNARRCEVFSEILHKALLSSSDPRSNEPSVLDEKSERWCWRSIEI